MQKFLMILLICNIILYILSFSQYSSVEQAYERAYQHWMDVHCTCLYLFGKCCRKHKRLPLTSFRHCILLYNTSDLWFKTHIQHTVCFIQDQIPAIPNLVCLCNQKLWITVWCECDTWTCAQASVRACTHTHTHTHTNKQTNKQTNKH